MVNKLKEPSMTKPIPRIWGGETKKKNLCELHPEFGETIWKMPIAFTLKANY